MQFLKAHGWISFGDLLASVAQVSCYMASSWYQLFSSSSQKFLLLSFKALKMSSVHKMLQSQQKITHIDAISQLLKKFLLEWDPHLDF